MSANFSPSSGLEDRIAHLEVLVTQQQHRLRVHRAAGAGALLLLAGGSMVAAVAQRAAPALLQAQRVEIVDAEGNVMVAMHAEAAGGQIDIWNGANRNVLRASCNANGGDLAIWNTEGRSVAGSYATATGGETALWSSQGELAFRAATGADTSSLELRVPGTQSAYMATASSSGGAFRATSPGGSTLVSGGMADGAAGGILSVYATDGTRSFAAAAEEDGCGRLDVYNNADNPVFTVDGQRDLGCVMALSNNVGSRLFMLGTRATGGLLNAMNDRGEVLAMFGVAEDGGGAMTLRNSSGMEIVHAGADEKRDGVITVRDGANSTMRVLRPGR
jgi:hypothetical protein